MQVRERIARYVNDPELDEALEAVASEQAAKDRTADALGQARDQEAELKRRAERKRRRARASEDPDEFLPVVQRAATATATEQDEKSPEELLAEAEEEETRVERLDAKRREHLQAWRQACGRCSRLLFPHVEQAVQELGEAYRALGLAQRQGGQRAPFALYRDELLPAREKVEHLTRALGSLLSQAGAKTGQERRVRRRLEAAVDVDAHLRLGYLTSRFLTWSRRPKSPVEDVWEREGLEAAGRSMVSAPRMTVAETTLEALRRGDVPFEINL